MSLMMLISLLFELYFNSIFLLSFDIKDVILLFLNSNNIWLPFLSNIADNLLYSLKPYINDLFEFIKNYLGIWFL